jgi:DNA-binding MarR family transcriptional regulator
MGMTENLPLVEQLVRVQTRLWNQLDRALLDQGQVSIAWLMALRVLADAPGRRVQDLAEHIDISPGGASKLVDRLVCARLVDREPDPADRRVSRLRLTASGRRVVRDGSRRAESWLAGRFGPAISDSDGLRLAALLDSLGAAIDGPEARA